MIKPTGSNLRAYIILGVGTLAIGFSAIFVRWAAAPGPVAAFYRMSVGVVVLALPFFQQIRSRRNLHRRGFLIAVLGGMFFAADVALWASGVVLAGATIPTLLANTAPVWVGLGAIILFKEKLGRKFWAGLLLGLTGVVLILGWETLGAISLESGPLLGLSASFFYAGYMLITQLGRESLDSLTYFWPATMSSAVALLVISQVMDLPLGGYSSSTYMAFIGLGLVSQVIGYLAINDALGYLPASVVSPSLLGQPVFTAILAMILLGERLSAMQIIGGLAVLSGIYLTHIGRRGPSDRMAMRSSRSSPLE